MHRVPVGFEYRATDKGEKNYEALCSPFGGAGFGITDVSALCAEDQRALLVLMDWFLSRRQRPESGAYLWTRPNSTKRALRLVRRARARDALFNAQMRPQLNATIATERAIANFNTLMLFLRDNGWIQCKVVYSDAL